MSRHRRGTPLHPGRPGPHSPTLEDPLVTEASEVVGGPIGARALPHPWWTPVRVVLAVACVAFLLGMVQKSPCVVKHWNLTDAERYGAMCYSDVPFMYTGRGFAERVLPFTDTDSRYRDLEYPVVIGYVAYASALVTHALDGWPDLAEREALPDGEVFRAPGVGDETQVFFVVTVILLAGAALASAYLLATVQRQRPWDAMAFVAAPALVLAGLINWDLLAVCALVAALWAWSRGRPLLSGILIGVGTATKLYPVFLLGALLVVCLRRRDAKSFALATLGAAGAWLVVNLPAMLWGFAHWKTFWSFNQHRGADLGSLWLVLQQATDHTIDFTTINQVSELFLLAVCVGVLLLGLLAPRPPRIAQLTFLIVCGFLVVNKVYSPQYVLWLLPLAVLARPRWRDLLIWQAAEVAYFAAVWLYLGGFTAASSGSDDRVYWAAIFVRVAAELWFAGLVVRDVLQPWHDPVRADGITDDPLQPEPATGISR